MEETTMTKTFDGIKDGKHVEVWTPIEEDKERAKARKEEMSRRKSRRQSKS